MERAYRKLNSKRGASILMALVVVLVVTMVSVIILSAATSNAGRVKRNQREEQAYLTVSSAARLMSSELAKDTMVYTLQTTVVTDENGKTTTEERGPTRIDEAVPFGKLMNDLVEAVPAGNAKRNFVITAENMQPVKVDITMYNGDSDHNKYSISALLYLESDDMGSNNYVELDCEGTYEKNTSKDDKAETTIETVKWAAPKLTKGQAPAKGSLNG